MIQLCKNIRVRMHAHAYVGLYMYDVCACIWLLMFVHLSQRFTQAVACCLTALKHCLGHCWLKALYPVWSAYEACSNMFLFITVWSLSLMMVFIGSGSGKGWLDGKPLPDEDHHPWFNIWHKSKMSWKGLIGVQILSYVLFINEIVAVRHMCCSWSTTQK